MADETRRTRYALLGVVLLVALAAGGAAAAYAPVFEDTTDRVAVVELEGQIDQQTAQHVEESLREARTNDSIGAVVLAVNSPGGLPAESERIYAAVEQTAAELPVRAAVDTSGASGAYLAMAPADEIYVAPSAQAIGSVGVTGQVTPPLAPDEGSTGPNKGGSHPVDGLERKQVLAELFADSVLEHRSEEIELNRTELLEADTYLGVEAVENGLADRIGFVGTAVQDVAAAAELGEYEVVTDEAETGGQSGLSIPLPVEDDSPLYLAVDPSLVTAENGTGVGEGEP